MRLTRTVRVFRTFPELYSMVIGFVSAMASVFWGFIMIIILLIICSILCGELILPINVSLDHEVPGATKHSFLYGMLS